MAHALELFFDPGSEAEIKKVWDQLEAAGLPSLATRTHRRHRPHVTLAVAERIETSRLQNVRDRVAATRLDMTLYSPAVFQRSGVLYLSLVPTMALLQRAIVNTCGSGLMTSTRTDLWDGYSR